MKARLAYLRHLARTSFWLRPVQLILVAIVAALSALGADRHLPTLALDLPWAPTGPEGARLVLSTIAGSMITVASLVFSLTLVTLTLAAQQLGPRLISLFMGDRLTQHVLGGFLAIFVYCLLVLRSVAGEPEPFVPTLSLLLAIVASGAGLLLLVAFVHNTARAVRADVAVARLAREALARIEALPEAEDAAPPVSPCPPADPEAARRIEADANGYVQTVDVDSLVACARERDLFIRLEVAPGQFVVAGAPLASVSGGDPDPESTAEMVRSAVVLGGWRTPAGDLLYALQGLAEVALRALSPGINDPWTAVACVDWLAACLSAFTRRQLPAARLADEDGVPRLERPVPDWDQLVLRTFADIRDAARGTPLVYERLAEALTRVAACTRSVGQRRAIEAEAAALLRTVRESVGDPAQRARIEASIGRIATVLASRLPAGADPGCASAPAA